MPKVLGAARAPVVLHWLGEAFDPRLRGYFGSTEVDEAMDDTVVSIIEADADKVAGIKMSLLDAQTERALRSRLPAGVRTYTGDDHHYVDLIRGDGDQHSDALLGRGLPGQGHIDFAPLTRAVERAGFGGDIEIEVFHQEVWDAPFARVIGECKRSFTEVVAPHLG